MSPINSKQKGKAGELELAHWFQAKGIGARRGQQYSGTETSADLVNIPHIYPECKRVEKLNVLQALERAEKDAPSGSLPAVFHRPNRAEWMVTMRLDDWWVLYSAHLYCEFQYLETYKKEVK